MFFKHKNKVDENLKKKLADQNSIKKDLELNTANLKTVFGESSDVVFKDVYINSNPDLTLTLAYIDGMINTQMVNDDILKPLVQECKLSEAKSSKLIIDLIEHGTVYTAHQNTRTDINDCISDMINGFVALVFDSPKTAVTFEVKGFEKRGITEPSSENVQKGAKDSFVETIRTNTATIRRKIKTPNLRMIETTIGKQSQTAVCIVYLEGLTNTHLVEEVKKQLDDIEIDVAINPGQIEEYIIGNKHTLFPQIASTERPDKFCANVVEGRVGLIIDGMPTSYIVPATINQLLQAPEDYSQNYIFSSLIRVIRYFLLFLTLFLPGIYIAVTEFNHEMIPTELALSIAKSKEGVPFPIAVEVFIMLIAFEILLEAGIRLPRNIGQAVSIVGGLVVGDAAVNAKIVSPGVVIIIAITAISTFTMPNQDFSNALRVWRFVMAILSSIGGLFTLTIGSLVLLFHFCTLESFGVPYLSPFVSSDNKSFKDTIFRFPLSMLKKRPEELHVTNKKRQK